MGGFFSSGAGFFFVVARAGVYGLCALALAHPLPGSAPRCPLIGARRPFRPAPAPTIATRCPEPSRGPSSPLRLEPPLNPLETPLNSLQSLDFSISPSLHII